MSNNKKFDNPEYLSCYELTTSQENKVLNFSTPQVFIEEPVVIIQEEDGCLVCKITKEDGIVLSADKKEIILTFQGVKFKDYAGKNLKGTCNFFIKGDREFLFDLIIIESFL